MFNPKTKRIGKLAELFPKPIKELENIFDGDSGIYLDWQNVIHWQEKLGWRFNLKRIKQFFDSFSTIKFIKIYVGTLKGNEQSENQITELKIMGYDVKTKLVKIMPISIDVSSIPKNSPALLQSFIRKSLLKKLDLESIEFLNSKLAELNQRGILSIKDQKCNFDVEIGREMSCDFESDGLDNYILWSVDSDFADPITQISSGGKRAVIFATSGRVSPELDATGVLIFDIKKIKEFICWPKDLPQGIKDKIDGQ
ncbi:MAG: hypothetical protein COS76_03420 [Candidatus Portnoybacteria bacterium CG06_land_8_20_14_3_00_39_12]|uniref:Uncharacterized protein n=1 Tax=Candidatus Portnoybacteria bacterium CG06_land_8_20_14_3_00_39_12 TaxID=1974809 RepID=A0A2M7AWC6_9BACT|nr:MAG: hypothetical protein COS76_03420 [Candidatus Portnoybacteria bacterium CG06_land_8_20_14_3_00_39_12]